MKQVLFNQDERFLLHLQRRDMIDTTDTDSDKEFKLSFRDPRMSFMWFKRKASDRRKGLSALEDN